MKKVLLSLGFVAVATIVSAQNFGAYTGLNMSNVKTFVKGSDVTDEMKDFVKESNKDQNMRLGFQIGGVVEWELSEVITLNTGVAFSQYGTTSKDGDYSSNMTLNYLQIPVTAAYKWELNNNLSLFGQAGLYGGYAISGKVTEKEDGEKDSESLSFGSDEENDDLSALDFGAIFGAGVEFNKFRVGVNYNWGFANLSNADQDNGDLDVKSGWKNSNLSLTFGYFFNK